MNEIQMYQFAGGYGVASFSPFCLKLQAYLRLAGVPYRAVNVRDTSKAPTKKLPYIVDGDQAVGDSGLIVTHLKNKAGIDPDAHLSAEQRAQAFVLTRMLEEHFAWLLVYSRWVDPDNAENLKKIFFRKVPAPVKMLIVPMLVRRVRRTIWGQGIGRHDKAAIYQRGRDDLDALATCLGDKNYLMGDQASTVDTVAFGFLANLLNTPFPSPLQNHARKHADLVRYVARMDQAWFANND
ncbi:glutathione S-transferase family protein [Acanthopleuribacter pedis]|uniref:Glutathione S-transferase family protein n=1 Tax=Acanthopleuribacter pedis TaxID=442870 RepID=A0A8J7QAI1_9BACT|nr:glutathione S-transferase family protein [Acanthopleuribacter pedis]MBO1317216.1 glutathione S-transferase family protein [Acanthopleuribacter pedis]MBO1318522.1 glutathione S-transferase family protein [Acanthopleuribacter pedis]